MIVEVKSEGGPSGKAAAMDASRTSRASASGDQTSAAKVPSKVAGACHTVTASIGASSAAASSAALRRAATDEADASTPTSIVRAVELSITEPASRDAPMHPVTASFA
jgi:hypothetical protein